MKRWLPAPLLSACLLALWLLLNESFAPGHLVIGTLAALVLPRLTAPLRPAAGRMRRPLTAMRLIGVVCFDVVRSALQVARAVLGARRRPPRSRFVLVPLELREVHGLAALAVITTVVPGTVWSELAPDRGILRLHVFDSGDDASFIAEYKTRYERPLMEIFE
ncbi:MAG: Na+/H+ antiporter subunit E [Rhizobacter sp.]